MLGNINSKSAQSSNVFCSVLNAERLDVDFLIAEATENRSVTPFTTIPPVFNIGVITVARNATLSGIPVPRTGDFTLAGEQIVDGNIVVDTSGANVNITTDSAANILTEMGFGSLTGGNTILFITDIGLGANTLTILPGAGVDVQTSGTPAGTYLVQSLGATVRITHLK